VSKLRSPEETPRTSPFSSWSVETKNRPPKLFKHLSFCVRGFVVAVSVLLFETTAHLSLRRVQETLFADSSRTVR
jgi:hypothetical protein